MTFLPLSARARALGCGLLAASATSGAVLGFGWRAGTPVRAFNVIASLVAGDRARGVWGWDGRVTPVGIALVVVVMFAWGALFGVVARRAQGWRLVATAVGVALASWTVSTVTVAQRIAPEAARVLGPGQLVGLHLVLAVTLAVGMRFAFRGEQRDDGVV